MTAIVELVPINEGNRITVNENEKVIIGRGSSLGCNEKKISRHHAELLLKEDKTLWIKPTHANPVFYRPLNGKIVQLVKDVERQLKDGDQIGLLPTSYYFRVSFSKDINNNQESDSDVSPPPKKTKNRSRSPEPLSPDPASRLSSSNQEDSVFNFNDNDDEDDFVPAAGKKTPIKRLSIEKKDSKTASPCQPPPKAEVKESPKPVDPAHRPRKLPKWMVSPASATTAATTPSALKQTPSSSSISKTPKKTTPTSTNAKRHLSFDGDSDDASNMSDIRSPSTPGETKSPGKALSRMSSMKSFDSDSNEPSESTSTRTPPPSKKTKSGDRKRRPLCPFGASCYRKNPLHRSEQSHPGDSDYEDLKASGDGYFDDEDMDKPECPFGKACYRQNPQHKRDFKH